MNKIEWIDQMYINIGVNWKYKLGVNNERNWNRIFVNKIMDRVSWIEDSRDNFKAQQWYWNQKNLVKISMKFLKVLTLTY